MVDAVYVLPTGGPMAQVCRLGPKVGGRLALFCIQLVNRVNSCNESLSYDVSTINIVLAFATSFLSCAATCELALYKYL